MEENATLLAQSTNLADRLERTDLVVGGHDADQDGLWRQAPRNLLHRHTALSIDRQDSNLEPLAAKPAERVKDRLVFGGSRDEMIALGPIHGGNALENEIVALGCAAGEDDVTRMSADQAGHLLTGLLHSLLGLPAECVGETGGIAVTLGEIGQHHLDHARIGPRRGVVVQVDPPSVSAPYSIGRDHTIILP